MRTHCFILASSDDRIHLLNKCVRCIKNSMYAQSDVYLYYQGTNIEAVEDKHFFKSIIVDDRLRGVFIPRYELMRRFCLDYDFTILIDDDLFMYPYTSYENCMDFLEFNQSAGCCCISMHGQKIKNVIKCVSDTKEDYNVFGGMVFPKRSIKCILEYFEDKAIEYSEDMVWLLLYVKGFDLYRDYSSKAIHICNQKTKDGKPTGFLKARYERAYVPILPNWFNSKRVFNKLHGRIMWKIKEVSDINEQGKAERMRNLK